jgi:hypothetical protein
MTVFLCILAVMSLLEFGDYTIRRPYPALLLFGLQSLSVLMTLGLSALALASYLS